MICHWLLQAYFRVSILSVVSLCMSFSYFLLLLIIQTRFCIITVPVCQWQGIGCSGTNINSIDISGVGFHGSLPSEFGQLLSLTTLHLSNNTFVGNIPSEVAQLPLLQSIDVTGNTFEGSIPKFSSSLKEIVLQNNRFSGSLPSDYFSSLGNLETFDVSSNNMGGYIPESISSAPSLTTLDLSTNWFSGKSSCSFFSSFWVSFH